MRIHLGRVRALGVGPPMRAFAIFGLHAVGTIGGIVVGTQWNDSKSLHETEKALETDGYLCQYRATRQKEGRPGLPFKRLHDLLRQVGKGK